MLLRDVMKTQFPVEEIKESVQRRILQAEKHMTNDDDDFFTTKALDRNQKGKIVLSHFSLIFAFFYR